MTWHGMVVHIPPKLKWLGNCFVNNDKEVAMSTIAQPNTQTLSVVNLAARQRMLSQRMILQVVLAADGRSDMAQAARQSLKLFTDSHASLLETVRHMEPAHAQHVQQTYSGPGGAGPVIERFIQQVRNALNNIETASSLAARTVDELVSCTDTVLSALNTVTTAFDQVSRSKEEALMRELTGIVSDIQSVAKEAKVVSFNAQVIAARAGEHGRGFAVVANVLSGITQEIDRQSKRAMELTERNRVAA